jgi:hypothetical protein
MLIDPGSDLFLLRLQQQQRARDLGHLVAIRAARHNADALATTSSTVSSLRQRLLVPCPPLRPRAAPNARAIPISTWREAGARDRVGDGV